MNFAPARHVPDSDSEVITGCCQRLPVRRKRHCADAAGMTAKGGDMFSGRGTRQANRPVEAGGSQQLAVGRIGHSRHE